MTPGREELAELLERVLLSAAECSTVTGIGVDVVYGALHRGELRHLRVGRTYRVPPAEVRAWVARLVEVAVPASASDPDGLVGHTCQACGIATVVLEATVAEGEWAWEVRCWNGHPLIPAPGQLYNGMLRVAALPGGAIR